MLSTRCFARRRILPALGLLVVVASPLAAVAYEFEPDEGLHEGEWYDLSDRAGDRDDAYDYWDVDGSWYESYDYEERGAWAAWREVEDPAIAPAADLYDYDDARLRDDGYADDRPWYESEAYQGIYGDDAGWWNDSEADAWWDDDE